MATEINYAGFPWRLLAIGRVVMVTLAVALALATWAATERVVPCLCVGPVRLGEHVWDISSPSTIIPFNYLSYDNLLSLLK
jgi:hypothetical protein